MGEGAKAQCCLLALCGLPGAGKSSLAIGLQAVDKAGVRCTHVQFDAASAQFNPSQWKARPPLPALPLLLHCWQAPHAWPGVPPQASRQRSLDAIASLLAEAQPSGHHLVIADDTMHYRSMRRECRRLARDAGAACVQAHVSCPLPLALERNSRRPAGQRIPDAVLRRTAAIFESPAAGGDDAEGAASLLVDAGRAVSAEAVWGRVWAAWGQPPEPLPDEAHEAAALAAARGATAESAVHQADLACRQALAEALRRLHGLPAGAKAEAARELNEARRRQLAALRAGGVAAAEAAAAFRACCERCVGRRLQVPGS
jgi:predicted kinase